MFGLARLGVASRELARRVFRSPSFKPARSARRPLRRARTRLWVEPLEDRTLPAVSLAGTIFTDLDHSGAFNVGDPGVAAATVFIDVNHNGVLDTQFRFNASSVPGPTALVTPSPIADTLAVTDPLIVSGVQGPITDFKVKLNLQTTTAGAIRVALLSPTGFASAIGPDLISLNDNERQTVTVPGTATQIRFSFNGVSGNALTYSSATTAAQVKANLNSIPALLNGNVSNVSVTGNNGGPYTVTFVNQLAGSDVSNLVGTVTAGTGNVTVTEALKGRSGGSFDGTLDDAAATAIANLNAPTTGTFRPLQGFNNMQRFIYNGAGTPNGGWRLLFYSTTGTTSLAGLVINSWSIEFNASEQTAVSDAVGQYAFNDLPAGPIRVAVANAPTSNPGTDVLIPATDQAPNTNLAVTPNPDLAGTDCRVSGDSLNWGSSATVTYTITNNGPGDAGPSSAEIRLSKDGTLDATDALLALVPVPALAAGASFTGSTEVALPGSSQSPPTGFNGLDLSFLGLRLDRDNTVAEVNESNNANTGNGLDLAPIVPFGNRNVTAAAGVQQQPSLAVDPTNAQHLVMAYLDYGQPSDPGFTGYARIAVAVSTNGGATWTKTAIASPANFDEAAGYPVVRFDSLGTPYVVFMAVKFLGANKPPVIFPDGASRLGEVLTRSFGMEANNGIFIARGTSGGLAWDAPVAVTSRTYTTPNKVPFDTLPDLAIDPNTGKLYVTFTRFYPPGQFPSATGTSHTGGSDIWVYTFNTTTQQWQPTNGATATTPAIRGTTLDNQEIGAGGQTNSKIAVASDGSVFVSFFLSVGGRFSIFRSTNSGATFAAVVSGTASDPFLSTSQSKTIADYSAEAGLPFRNLPSRDIAVDPMRPGTVYVADAIAISANGSIVNAVDQADIAFARSGNNGTTWLNYFSTAGSVGNLNTLTDNNDRLLYRSAVNDDNDNRYLRSLTDLTNEVRSRQAIPQLVVDNHGNLILVWLDTRRDPGNRKIDVFGAISTDGGFTFGPNFRLTDVTFDALDGAFIDPTGGKNIFLGDALGLAARDGVVYVAWTDTRTGNTSTGNQDIFFTRFSLEALPPAQGDRYEPNNDRDTPTNLGDITVLRVFPRLAADQDDADFYRITPAASGTLSVGVKGSAALGLQILDAVSGTVLAEGTDLRDATGQVIGKQILLLVTANQPLLARVTGNSADDSATPYSLSVQALTADLGTRVYGVEERNLPAGGQHVFALTAAVNGSVTVQLADLGITGTFRLRLLSGDGVTQLGTALAPGPDGVAQVAASVRQGQTILVQVLPADEQQTVTIPSTVTQVRFSFNGVAATATQAITSATTAAQIQANLNTIPALSGNVLVTGPNGGPFVVSFINQLAGQDQPNLTVTVTAGTGTPTVAETVKGGGTGNYKLTFTNLDQFQTPGQSAVFFPTFGDPGTLAAGNLNADDRPDVATASPTLANPVNVLLNDTTGLLGAPRAFEGGSGGSTLPGGNVRTLTLAEFTGDLILDVAMTNFASADVTVLPGRGDGTLGSDHRSDAVFFPGSLVAARFDADDITDLAVFPVTTVVGQSPQFALLSGRGDGTFLPPLLIQTTLPSGSTFGVIADFNHDQKADIAVFSLNGLNFEVYLGNGDGTFADPIPGALPELARVAVAADLDGDGNSDLVSGSTVSGNVHTLLSNGDGTFRRGPSAFANTDPVRASSRVLGLAVVDAGGPDGLGVADGLLDVLVVMQPVVGGGAPQVNFLAGLAAAPGTFGGFGNLRQLATGPFSGPIAAADFDNDGRLDVVVAETGGVRVLYSRPLNIPANRTPETARNLGTVVHLVTAKQAISPDFADAWFTLTVPTEAVQGAGDEVIDFAALFEHTEGAGLALEVLDAGGNVLGTGPSFRLRVAQGQVLTLHVFGVADPNNAGVRGSGAYTLSINVLPRVVQVEAPALLPGQNDQPGGPISTLVITFQGDRLDPDTAEDPANYRITWLGPDGQVGGGDDQELHPAGPASERPIVYAPGANTVPSSGRTFPTAVRQTVTLFFADPLPAGSYLIEVFAGVQTADFNPGEDALLAGVPGSSGHPVVSLVNDQITEGSSRLEAGLVKPVGQLDPTFPGYAEGTVFLTQFHGNLGALLNALQDVLGDALDVSRGINTQILDTFLPGAAGVSFLIIWLDPVSIRLEDPQGARAVYNLQTGALTNTLARAYIEVGGNIEVMVLPGVLGTFTLNIADVLPQARGGAVVIGGGGEHVQSVSLTDAIRNGERAFQFTVAERSPTPGSTLTPANPGTNPGEPPGGGTTPGPGGGGSTPNPPTSPSPSPGNRSPGPTPTPPAPVPPIVPPLPEPGTPSPPAPGGTGSPLQNLTFLNASLLSTFVTLFPQLTTVTVPGQAGAGEGTSSARSAGSSDPAVANPPSAGGEGTRPRTIEEWLRELGITGGLEQGDLPPSILGVLDALLEWLRRNRPQVLERGSALPRPRPAGDELPAAPEPLPAPMAQQGEESEDAIFGEELPADLLVQDELPGDARALLSAAVFATGFCRSWGEEELVPERRTQRRRRGRRDDLAV